MSITGMDLRRRARRRLVRALDRAVAWLDPEHEQADASAPPAPTARPEPAEPTARPQAAPPPPAADPPRPAPVKAPPPLPEVPKALKPLPAPESDRGPKATPKAAPAPKAEGAVTPAGKAAEVSPEERRERHWRKTRLGMLQYVHDQGGKATLRDMHGHSERTFFVAHVSFSKLMEELTDEGLLAYDHESAMATLTPEGLSELSG